MPRRPPLPTRIEFWSAVMRVLGVLTLVASAFIAALLWNNADAVAAIAVFVGGIASSLPIFALSAILDGVGESIDK